MQGGWYSEAFLRRCLLQRRVASMFTVCSPRIAKSVSRTRDISWTEVWEIRTNKVGMHTQNTCMVSNAVPSEWRHKRNMLGNHNLYSATYGKLSLFVLED